MKQIIFIANKKLPDNDYRVHYAIKTRMWKVILGLPDKPDIINNDQFEKFNFREGLSFSDINDFFRLYNYLKNNKDIVLVHYFSTKLMLFGPIIAYMAGKNSIITCTGFGRVFQRNNPIFLILRLVYLFLISISISFTKYALFQNHSDMFFLSKIIFWKKSAIKYIGSSIVMDYEFKEKNYCQPKLRIISVARIIPSKGIDDYLNIAKELQSTNLEFILVGPSSIGHDKLLKDVYEYHNNGYIKYYGEIFNEELYSLLDDAHIFLFTSFYGEGLSRVLLEAGFAKLCPVVYDINANRDLVNNDRGEIVEVRNISEIKKIILNLNKNRQLLRDKANIYNEFTKKYYSFEQYKNKLDEIITSSIKN